MTSITIRNAGPALNQRLRLRAAGQDHSMEAEARLILERALDGDDPMTGLDPYERIHTRFAAIGAVDLELPPREAGREPPRFD